MVGGVDVPTLELLSWISERQRTYRETIETWVSNCPRLSVWDDAISAGLVEVVRDGAGEPVVGVTASGKAVLERAPTTGWPQSVRT
jgi:hypothetical protein